MRSLVVGPITIAAPTVTITDPTVLQAELHSMAATTINGSGGAFVALGSGVGMAGAITRIQLSYTASEPLAFRVATSAANAAAASNDDWVLNQGDGPVLIYKAIISGGKIWVRSKSTNSISTGYVSANLMG